MKEVDDNCENIHNYAVLIENILQTKKAETTLKIYR